MILWSDDEPLDFLVCGHPVNRLDGLRPYGELRGNATRAFGLANNFSRQGARTGLVVEDDCSADESPLISSSLRLVSRSDFARAAAVTKTLVYAGTNLKTLREHKPEIATLQHPRKWIATCFDNNGDEDVETLARGAVGISFNNMVQAQNWQKRGLPFKVHVMPYGVDENAYIDHHIVQARRPTAVWIGSLRLPILLERLVRFAEVNPECEVKVISGLVFDQRVARGKEGSLDLPLIDHRSGAVPGEVFSQVVQAWCGRPAPPNLHYLGSCAGQNADHLGSATLALGFSRCMGQQHDDSKILDYLRSGTPVLCDDGQPSCRFVQLSGHGFVMPFDAGDQALREGFSRCLALSAVGRKRAVAADIRENFGWPALAAQITSILRHADAQKRDPDGLTVQTGELKMNQPLRLLYVPWIEGHTGALVRLIEAAGGVEFVPLPLLDLIPGRPGAHRFEIMQLAKTDPVLFRRLLANLVHRLNEPVNALFLTVDWCDGLRQVVEAFVESGFPTVLAPHESVFARQELYYRDPVTGINTPLADVALLWGGLQHQIFTQRGLEPHRLVVLGSPKLEFIANYTSSVSRQQFYTSLGMSGEAPTVLFVAQPLDCQYETPVALEAQSQAIFDCLEICSRNGWRLVVRIPPARNLGILNAELVSALKQNSIVFIDGSEEGCYRASPYDAMYHADAVVSINSTMLLEASLIGRPAISVGYVDGDQFWHRKGGMPLVSNSVAMESALIEAMRVRGSLLSAEGLTWITWAFSNGSFEGGAARRIVDYIKQRWPAIRVPKLSEQF